MHTYIGWRTFVFAKLSVFFHCYHLMNCFIFFSMEECDALCTRLVIMVNGQFVCLGSPQHLKDKFGNGYTLIVRLSAENSDSAKVKNFITEEFPDSQVFDDHHDYLHFRIPNTSVSLSSVFGAMEKASENLGIEDYSVHQTTLEQVFLSFTNKQVPPEEKKKHKGCCGLCTCCTLCACACCCGDDWCQFVFSLTVIMHV